ncbi:MAG: hypothetical protein NC318_09410 [Blautia sp.]|nr:hypothetical protein [Blautia sp.]
MEKDEQFRVPGDRRVNRLGIFVFYDREGIADDYISYLLDGIKSIADKIVIVVNGIINDVSLKSFYKYTDTVIIRENNGFDAGAYKDALCKYLGWDNVGKFDELLLVNDTFYGPIYPLKDIFNEMEKINTDYWGITRSPGGTLDNGYEYDTHIQSFFIVFRKGILLDNGFREFWEEMIYPESFLHAVILFELECNKYLIKHGFKGTALTDLCELKYHAEENDNPHLLFSYEMIHDANIPTIKRKSLSLTNKGFKSAIKALKYIKERNLYDVNLIEKHLMRIGKTAQVWKGINYSKLTDFYNAHLKVYIYGAGICGKNLAEYFRYKGWSFEGFLVTNPENNSDECIPFDMADISDDDGIIIAVGNQEIFNEILEIVEKRCNRNQICI